MLIKRDTDVAKSEEYTIIIDNRKLYANLLFFIVGTAVLLTFIFIAASGVKSVKIYPVVVGDSLYGFYTFKSDTSETILGDKKVIITYEDIYRYEASFLVGESDTTSSDSIKSFQKAVENKSIYPGFIDNLPEKLSLKNHDDIVNYIFANFKPMVTTDVSFREIDGGGTIKKKDKVVGADKGKKSYASDLTAKVKQVISESSAPTKEVHIKDIIKDEKMLAFLTEANHLHNYSYYAIDRKYPPSVFIAMGALESGYGKSTLVNATKNHGNIKCKCNRNGELRKEHARLANAGTPVCKGAYDKIEQGYDYYVIYEANWKGIRNKFKILDNYKIIKNLKDNPSIEELCTAIHKSPYATDVNYGKKIMKIINSSNLRVLDKYIAEGYNVTSGSIIKYTILDQKKLPHKF